MILKIGDRFWIEPEYTGLGKRYWFIVIGIEENKYHLKIDGEVE